MGYSISGSTRRRGGRVRSAMIVIGWLWCCLGTVQAGAAIRVAVEANPNPAVPGELLNVEVTISNDGSTTSGALAINLPVDQGLDSFSDSAFGGQCPSISCESGETFVLSVGALAGGNGRSFTLNPRLSSSVTAGDIVEFSVSATEDGSNAASATASVTVVATEFLDVTLSEDADPVKENGQLRYTLDYGVDSSSAGSASTTLRLNLPAGVTLVDAPGGVLSGATIDWNVGALNPGTSGQRYAVVTVDPGQNSGSILEASAELIGASASVSFATTTRVQNNQPLQVAIALASNPAKATTESAKYLDVELFVANTSSLTLSDVALVFEYPVGLASIGDSATPGGQCPSIACEAAEQLIFTIPSLAAGRSKVFHLPLSVSTNATDGTVIYLEAYGTSAAGAFSETSAGLAVDSGRERELRVLANGDPLVAGGTFTVELAYGLLTASAGSPNAQLNLEIPGELNLESASDLGVNNSGLVQWPIGALNPGDSGVRTATFSVAPGTSSGTLVDLRANLTDTTNSQLTVRAVQTQRIEPPTNLLLEVSANSDVVRAGELLDVEFLVGNQSSLSLSGVVLAVELPAQFLSISDSLFEGDCPSIACEPGEFAVFTIGELAAGATTVVSIPLRVSSTAAKGSSISLEASVEDATGVVVRGGRLFLIDTDLKLQLELLEQLDPVAPGITNTYTLGYGLLDDATGISGAQMELELPAGVSFVSASSGGTHTAGVVSWNLGALSPGATGVRTVVVETGASVVTGSLLRARARLADSNNVQARIRSDQVTRVESQPDLALSIIANPDPALPGELIDVEVTVVNQTALNRSDVLISFEFPDGLSALSDSFVAGGDCPSISCEAQELIQFSISSLPAREGRTFAFPVRVASTNQSGSVINFDVLAQDSTGDRVSAGDLVTVNSGRQLQLELVESKDSVAPGESFSYQITVAQIEPGANSSNTLAVLTLPQDVDLVSASDNGSLSGKEITWNLGALNAGEGMTLTAAVAVRAEAVTGSLQVAQASVSDTTDSLPATRVDAASRVQAPQVLTLNSALNSVRVLPGETLELDLTVTNTGSLNRSGISLAVEYPTGLNSISDSNVIGGDCPSIACEAAERVFYDIGTLTAGEVRNLRLQATVNSAFANGNIISFDALVVDSTGATVESGIAAFVGRMAVADDDGDNIPDSVDNCPSIANPGQENFDGDDAGDVCDSDDDNDGVDDQVDAFPLNPAESVDTDNDRIGNVADLDDDNDGLLDVFEVANQFDPLNPADALGDADLDGSTNLAEAQAGTDPRDPGSQPGNPVNVTLVSSVLPSSRSVQVGEIATAFATIINVGAEPAVQCSFVPSTPVPGSFFFQATDSVTNASIGTLNGRVDIPGNFGVQTFVFGFTPSAVVESAEVELRYDCENTEAASSLVGINSFLLSAAAAPVPDVVALVAAEVGFVNLNQDPALGGAFAVASINVGSSGTVMFSADATDSALNLNISWCQTDLMGFCMAPPANAALPVAIDTNETPTFGVFVFGTGEVSENAITRRVRARFVDAGGVVRGSTSVAVRTRPGVQ